MKAIYKIITIGILGFSSASCTDLDLENDGRLQMKDIFSRQDRTRQMFESLGASLPLVDLELSPGTFPMLASFSDEAQDACDGIDGTLAKWYAGRVSPQSNPVAFSLDYWVSFFNAAYNCNVFISNLSNPEIATYPFNPILKEGWIAEAKVLRSYYYWQILKRYGAIPMMTEPYPGNQDFSQVQRPSFEWCVDFIMRDLEEALATEYDDDLNVGFRWLPSKATSITRYAAYALMSEAALYAASPLHNPAQTGKYTWEEAAKICKRALDACLAEDASLFNRKPENNAAHNVYDYYFLTQADLPRAIDKETLLKSRRKINMWRLGGLPINAGMTETGPCPSQELVDCYDMANGQEAITGYSDPDHLKPVVNAASGYDDAKPYEGRDPRFYASIYYNGARRNLNDPNDIVYTHEGGNCEISDKTDDVRFTRTGYYVKKFHNYLSDKANSSDGFMPLFRLAELYLNFAEAAYQAQGPDTKFNGMSAVDAVNTIRARVGMPGLPSGMSKADFERRYRKERRVELAFEDHRFFDVRRWKIITDTDRFVTGMKATKNADGSFSYQRFKLSDRNCASEKFLLLPVNQSEVSKMLELSGSNWQNPGW